MPDETSSAAHAEVGGEAERRVEDQRDDSAITTARSSAAAMNAPLFEIANAVLSESPPGWRLRRSAS
jgi:hypothetical protein